MQVYLPSPYPDEPLYSVIARYLIRVGRANEHAAVCAIFGKLVRKPSVDLPGCLTRISNITSAAWTMSSDDIVREMTLFAYYAHYVVEKRSLQCLEAMKSDKGMHRSAALGVHVSSVTVPPYLRHCRRCKLRDLKKYGETYWHRAHQLSGVLVCAEHSEPLIASTVVMKSVASDEHYYDANSVDTWHDTLDLNICDLQMANRIAQRAYQILSGVETRWRTTSYRTALIERGLSNSIEVLPVAQIKGKLVEFFGERLLSEMGCQVGSNNKDNWIRRILSPHWEKPIHPAYHILMQLFLESFEVKPNKFPNIGTGPWKCPNPYFCHEEEYPIKQIKFEVCKDKAIRAFANCHCGYRFSFGEVEAADPHIPKVYTLIELGLAWRHEAERLLKKGMAITRVAKTMGIGVPRLRRLLISDTSRDNKPSYTQNEIESLRKEWLNTLALADGHRADAIRLNRNLFLKLKQYDHNWLYSVRYKSGHWHPRQADWSRRDEEWHRKLIKAASEIKALVPLRQATKMRIIALAGIYNHILERLGRLPKCKLALEQNVESLEDYYARAIKAAAMQGLEQGKRINKELICKLTGLGASRNPERKGSIEELVEKEITIA